MDAIKNELNQAAQKFEHDKFAHEKNKLLHTCAYLVVFLFVASFTGYLVRLGWVQTPEVSIQYNVGEIIGAILVGAGAAAAGIAFALDTIRKKKPEDQKS